MRLLLSMCLISTLSFGEVQELDCPSGSQGPAGKDGIDGKDAVSCSISLQNLTCASGKAKYDAYFVCGDDEVYLGYIQEANSDLCD